MPLVKRAGHAAVEGVRSPILAVHVRGPVWADSREESHSRSRGVNQLGCLWALATWLQFGSGYHDFTRELILRARGVGGMEVRIWHALLQSIEDEQKAFLSRFVHLISNHSQQAIPELRLGSGIFAQVGIDQTTVQRRAG